MGLKDGFGRFLEDLGRGEWREGEFVKERKGRRMRVEEAMRKRERGGERFRVKGGGEGVVYSRRYWEWSER